MKAVSPEYQQVALPENQETESLDLLAALTHPDFLNGVRAIARHARLKGIEGGLAVYRETVGSLSVSSPILPSIEEIRRLPIYSSLPAEEAALAGYTSFRAHELLMYEDPQSGNLIDRRDVFLFIHSHPLHHEGEQKNSINSLAPSLSDLEVSETLNRCSPGVTEGILVSHRKDTRLLLYKASPSRDFQQYYTRFNKDPGRQELLRVMQESGYNIAELQIGPPNKDYAAQVAEAAIVLNS
ncbi:hypothetical protein BVY00_01740 [bacterium G20]|nr:hypothetical protein BVY00_01740 [bacterium G20]